MKLKIIKNRGRWRWVAVFDNYMPFLIGDVKKMPTVMDALRIVKSWKLSVVDGYPYYFNKHKGVWQAYGT